MCCPLEISRLRSAREWNHVADVLHTCHEEDETLKTKTKSSMRTRTKLASVEIPPHVLHRNVALVNLVGQFLHALFAHRPTDNLTNLREEHISALHCLLHLLALKHRLLIVYLHVECLDSLRVVSHDYRSLEVLLHEETLMLRSEVITPFAWELKLLAILDCLLKNFNTLCVGQTYKILFQHAFQTLNQALVYHLVQELKIILTVVESPLHTELDEVLLQVHQVIQINESHLRLYHPELCQMARSIGVFRTESRTESIDGAESCSSLFALQLTRYSQ